jgi:hypothetical protein
MGKEIKDYLEALKFFDSASKVKDTVKLVGMLNGNKG